jgi:hypothetical protein
MLRLLEEARAALLPKLTLKPDARHVVWLAANRTEFQQMSSIPEPIPPGAVALAGTDYRRTSAHPFRPESRQMVANVDAILNRPEIPVEYRHEADPQVTAKEIFQHELAHLALTRFTRPTTPGWVVEGAATHLSGESRGAEWRSGQAAGVFETMSFAELGGQEDLMNSAEYAYAKAAVEYLVQAGGSEKFWDFYQNFKDVGRSQPMGGMGHSQDEMRKVLSEATHRLLRRFYNMDEEDLDRQTLAYIEKELLTE